MCHQGLEIKNTYYMHWSFSHAFKEIVNSSKSWKLLRNCKSKDLIIMEDLDVKVGTKVVDDTVVNQVKGVKMIMYNPG